MTKHLGRAAPGLFPTWRFYGLGSGIPESLLSHLLCPWSIGLQGTHREWWLTGTGFIAVWETSSLLVLEMPKAPGRLGPWPCSHMEVLGSRGTECQKHCFLTYYIDQLLFSTELTGNNANILGLIFRAIDRIHLVAATSHTYLNQINIYSKTLFKIDDCWKWRRHMSMTQ